MKFILFFEIKQEIPHTEVHTDENQVNGKNWTDISARVIHKRRRQLEGGWKGLRIGQNYRWIVLKKC